MPNFFYFSSDHSFCISTIAENNTASRGSLHPMKHSLEYLLASSTTLLPNLNFFDARSQRSAILFTPYRTLWKVLPIIQPHWITDIPYPASEPATSSHNRDIPSGISHMPLSCMGMGEGTPAYPRHLSQSTIGWSRAGIVCRPWIQVAKCGYQGIESSGWKCEGRFIYHAWMCPDCGQAKTDWFTVSLFAFCWRFSLKSCWSAWGNEKGAFANNRSNSQSPRSFVHQPFLRGHLRI